jgi:MFS transporter, MHS family, alpha-ketoglutarate permease
LNSLAVFAVGFVARPIGGAVLGLLADRIGRKVVMIWSVGVTAFASLVIGALPAHEVLGAWAGVIVLVCRIVQGVSTGIEAPLSNAYGLELVPDRPGYVAGFMAFFNNLGNLLAPLTSFGVSALLGHDAMSQYGWRVPFVLGGVLGILVLWLRRSLPETLPARTGSRTESAVIWRGVRYYRFNVLAVIFVIGAIQAYNYTWLSGLPSMATGTFGEDPTPVFAVSTALSIVLTLGALMLSRILDRWALSGWFIVGRVLAIPTSFLVLLYSGGIGPLAGVMLGGSAVLLLNLTIYNAVANALFPQNIRGTAMGIGYGIGVALFGGTAPYLFVLLRTLDLGWAFPSYIAALCGVSVVCYARAKKRHGVFIGR